MEKEVLIHVRGLHLMRGETEDEPIEIVVPGEYYFRNGSHYLRYEEVAEDFSQPLINYIKMSPNGMEVRKKGPVDVHLVFEQGKKNMSFYTTPFGTIQMGVAATSLELSEQEDSIDMTVDYALEMNEQHVADCNISIQAQAKNSANFSL